MTLDEWIAFYDKKTPEPFKRDERYNLFFRPDKGFCEVGQDDGMIVIHQLAGDARFWRDAVTRAAKESGMESCGTWCIRREILAYIRLFGFRIESTEATTDGKKRYHCINKTTGKKGLVSPAWEYADGTQAYFITWEV